MIITRDLPVIRRNHNIGINLKYSSQTRRQTRKLASTFTSCDTAQSSFTLSAELYPVSRFLLIQTVTLESLRECEKAADNGRHASLNSFVVLNSVLTAHSFLLHYVFVVLKYGHLYMFMGVS